MHTRDAVGCLGVHVGRNGLSCDGKDWDERVFGLEKILFSWRRRGLAFFGKIAVLKTLGLSPLMFSMRDAAMPEGKVELIGGIVCSFLWKKRERIGGKAVVGDVERGGLGVVGVEGFRAALGAKWVGGIMDGSGGWSAVGNHLVGGFAGDRLLLGIHVHGVGYMGDMPPFCGQVVGCCVEIGSFVQGGPAAIGELLGQPVWHSRCLFARVGHRGRSMFLSDWIKGGVLYVGDLDCSGGHVSGSCMVEHLKNGSDFLVEMGEIGEALRPYGLLLAQMPGSLPVGDTALRCLGWTTGQLCGCCVGGSFIRPECRVMSQTVPDVASLDIRDSVGYGMVGGTDDMLAQFGFGVFHSVLVCGKVLHGWTGVGRGCPTCQSLHDIPHMLYFCGPSENVWKNVCDIMGFKVELKHILLFYDNDNYENIKVCDYCFTAISYCIYKYWLQCTEGRLCQMSLS